MSGHGFMTLGDAAVFVAVWAVLWWVVCRAARQWEGDE